MSTAWVSTVTTSLRSTTATAVSHGSSTSSALSSCKGSGGPCFVSVCIAPSSHIFLISYRTSVFYSEEFILALKGIQMMSKGVTKMDCVHSREPKVGCSEIVLRCKLV